MTLTTSTGSSQLAFMVAAARVGGLHVDETFEARLGDDLLPHTRLEDPEHGVTHLVATPPTTTAGATLTATYQASVEGDPAAAAAEAAHDGGDLERLSYLRPSRYAESDRLVAMARSEFDSMRGVELLNAVAQWVHDRLAYVPGASRSTDGAVETYLARAGVCRDFAHLVVALLRALDVPARLVSVYAPGLSPMDFHAVAEAWVEGGWHVVDATRMAPRQSLVRIATGRDAADTAFLSAYGAAVRMGKLNVVVAIKEGDLPVDDGRQLVRLA
jgi:transglutaminase-like putative cysteine protease